VPSEAVSWAATWRRFGVAITYVAVFTAVDAVFDTRSPDGRVAWVGWTSTNLFNLHHHPVAAMVTSGLFAQGGLASWAVLAAVALGVANWSLGNWRTAVVVVAAHVVGTLVSEGILGYQIGAGAAPASDRYIVDVGPSYVVVAALVAGIAYGAGASRLLSAAGFALLSPELFGGLSTLEVSAVGHLSAALLGLLVGYPLWRQVRRRATDQRTVRV
jgi:asparagine N-glycosylation enzyme membrane subunit Stt3